MDKLIANQERERERGKVPVWIADELERLENISNNIVHRESKFHYHLAQAPGND